MRSCGVKKNKKQKAKKKTQKERRQVKYRGRVRQTREVACEGTRGMELCGEEEEE